MWKRRGKTAGQIQLHDFLWIMARIVRLFLFCCCCCCNWIWLFCKCDWVCYWRAVTICIYITMRQWIYNSLSHSLSVRELFCLFCIFFISKIAALNIVFAGCVYNVSKRTSASICNFFWFNSKWAKKLKRKTKRNETKKWLHVVLHIASRSNAENTMDFGVPWFWDWISFIGWRVLAAAPSIFVSLLNFCETKMRSHVGANEKTCNPSSNKL